MYGAIPVQRNPCLAGAEPLSTAEHLRRVQATLADVLRLTGRVIANKHTWLASADDTRIITETALLTGQALPAETFKSASVALGFLLMAKFSLETLAKTIQEMPPS
jgi:hypothetical protein